MRESNVMFIETIKTYSVVKAIKYTKHALKTMIYAKQSKIILILQIIFTKYEVID